jgi:hypothetical protein
MSTAADKAIKIHDLCFNAGRPIFHVFMISCAAYRDTPRLMSQDTVGPRTIADTD